jgi:hypothetical protein
VRVAGGIGELCHNVFQRYAAGKRQGDIIIQNQLQS